MNLKSGRFWKDFAIACFWGALAGASPFLSLSVLFGFLAGAFGVIQGQAEAAPAALLMLLPLIIAYPLTFAALLLFGLPIYAAMARMGPVRPFLFGAIGGLIGIALFESYMDRWDWEILRLGMGFATGGVAGYVWARKMARLA